MSIKQLGFDTLNLSTSSAQEKLIGICCMLLVALIYNKFAVIQTSVSNFVASREYRVVYTATRCTGVWFYHSTPLAFQAISHYVYNNHSKTSKALRHNSFETVARSDLGQNYVLGVCQDIDIGNSIRLDLSSTIDSLPDPKSHIAQNQNKTESYTITLRSKRKTTKQITDAVEFFITQYKEDLLKLTNQRLYHFIYSGSKTQGTGDTKDICLSFITNEVSDLRKPETHNYETFEFMFNEHKEKMIATIDRLRDRSYYKKNGLKRKKGYLFHGPPGTGKTSSIMALANHDRRHIIEIPMSRVKTNYELELLLSLEVINNIRFKKEQLIIVFDEIDRCGTDLTDSEKDKDTKDKNSSTSLNSDTKKDKDRPSVEETLAEILKASKNDDKTNSSIDSWFVKDSNKDKLNLGSILSRLDGIGNYDGIVIIATTNFKNKLSPALYRHGRLEPIYFDYARKIDIVNMILKFYTLDEGQLSILQKSQLSLPDRCDELSCATIRHYILEYENDVLGLLKQLRSMIKLKL